MWRPFSNAIEIRQSIGGGCADESQGEESQGYDDRGRSARSPVKCRGPVFRVLFIQRLSHLRSLRGQVSRKNVLTADQQKSRRWIVHATALAQLPTQTCHGSWTYMINDWLPLQPLPQSSALHAIGREFDPLTAHRPKHFTPYFSGFFGVEESAMMPTDRLFRKDAAANQ